MYVSYAGPMPTHPLSSCAQHPPIQAKRARAHTHTRSTRQTGHCKKRPGCTRSCQMQSRTKAESCPACTRRLSAVHKTEQAIPVHLPDIGYSLWQRLSAKGARTQTDTDTHTHTHTRLSTNRRAQRQVRMSIPRPLVIKQDKACSTPFCSTGREEEAHPAPVHEGLQPPAAAHSAKPRGCKRQTQMLSRLSTGLWECFRALTSMSLCYFHCPPRFVESSDQQGKRKPNMLETECTIIGALHTHIGLPGLFTHTHTLSLSLSLSLCLSHCVR